MTGRPVSVLDPFESCSATVLPFCVARLGPDRGEAAFQETLRAALRDDDDRATSGL
jgi:hypothetical protein